MESRQTYRALAPFNSMSGIGAVIMEYEAIFKSIGEMREISSPADVPLPEGMNGLVWKVDKKYKFGIFSNKSKGQVFGGVKMSGICRGGYVGGKERMNPNSIEKQISEEATRSLRVKQSEMACVCASAAAVEEAKKAGVKYIIGVTYTERISKEELEKVGPSSIAGSVEELSELLGVQDAEG